MTLAVAFAALAVGCAANAGGLGRAHWPYRAPRAAILLWQATGLAWGLAIVGTALSVGLAPYGRGVLLGLGALSGRGVAPLGSVHYAALAAGAVVCGALLFALAAHVVHVVAARRRHRSLLALVARDDPGVPGALVLDHPGAAAYCLPGVRARVVVSAGTLRMLAPAELAAVLAHERAHARERHDLVLLPFASLRLALPGLPAVRDAIAAVHLLIEMRADDRARRQHASGPLARALVRFGGAAAGDAPCGALGAAGHEVVARVRRLVRPQPELPRGARCAVYGAALTVGALPVVLLCLPVA